MVLILESRSHLDLGDLPNLLAAELGVMTVRLERAIRSLDGVARVHVNRWGDGAAHLHVWFLARPFGRLQLRGTFLPLWDEILAPIPEAQWRENLALVSAWLGEFGGRALAVPPRIEWRAPSRLEDVDLSHDELVSADPADTGRPPPDRGTESGEARGGASGDEARTTAEGGETPDGPGAPNAAGSDGEVPPGTASEGEMAGPDRAEAEGGTSG